MLVREIWKFIHPRDHIPWGQCPREIWYSWMNKFSYFLNPHAINVLLYRMKPRIHVHVKYCWQTYFKSIGTLSQTFKNHIHNKWCVPSASDGFLSKNDNSCRKTCEACEGVKYDFYFTEYVFFPVWLRVLIFNPLSNQINLFMVINIWIFTSKSQNMCSFLWLFLKQRF
jgi:hypothetical protein